MGPPPPLWEPYVPGGGQGSPGQEGPTGCSGTVKPQASLESDHIVCKDADGGPPLPTLGGRPAQAPAHCAVGSMEAQRQGL